MATTITMPQLSDSMHDGVIVNWLKSEGDSVKMGDAIAEVSTDIANLEIESVEEGTLLKILGEVGAKIQVGAAIGIIGQKGETVDYSDVNLSEPKNYTAKIDSSLSRLFKEKASAFAKATADESASAKTSPNEPAVSAQVDQDSSGKDFVLHHPVDVPTDFTPVTNYSPDVIPADPPPVIITPLELNDADLSAVASTSALYTPVDILAKADNKEWKIKNADTYDGHFSLSGINLTGNSLKSPAEQPSAVRSTRVDKTVEEKDEFEFTAVGEDSNRPVESAGRLLSSPTVKNDESAKTDYVELDESKLRDSVSSWQETSPAVSSPEQIRTVRGELTSPMQVIHALPPEPVRADNSPGVLVANKAVATTKLLQTESILEKSLRETLSNTKNSSHKEQVKADLLNVPNSQPTMTNAHTVSGNNQADLSAVASAKVEESILEKSLRDVLKNIKGATAKIQDVSTQSMDVGSPSSSADFSAVARSAKVEVPTNRMTVSETRPANNISSSVPPPLANQFVGAGNVKQTIKDKEDYFAGYSYEELVDSGEFLEPEIERLRYMEQPLAAGYRNNLNVSAHAPVSNYFFMTVKVIVDELLDVVSTLRQSGKYPNLSVNHLIIKAVSIALAKNPGVNYFYKDKQVEFTDKIDLGVVTLVNGRMVTPVIQNAGHMTVAEISHQALKLSKQVKTGELSPSDFGSATFNVSNVGNNSIEHVGMTIDARLGSMLMLSAIGNEPVALSREELEVKSVLRMTLSADSKIVSTVIAVRFLNDLKMILEKPALILG